jgi:SNF2 family DNA or RNA helicase
MQYRPHSYQVYATEFIKSNAIAAILLDMGMGKSVITLTALADLLFSSSEVHRILVVAPLRVARDTWPEEIAKWDHLSHLRYSVAVGTEQERKAALKARADIYIINRENVSWLVEQSGLPFDYDTVVLDELSSFKNHQSKRFKGLLKCRPLVKRIIGLTGTPASNGLMDLWAEFRLLDKGKRLGRFIGQYRTEYFFPDKHNGRIIFSYMLKPDAEKRIYEKIADVTISMKSTDYLKMPELVSAEYPVRLNKRERDVYNKFRQELVLNLEGGEVTASNAAALVSKLCQMANGSVYGDDLSRHLIHDCKLDALEDLIEAGNGRPLLIAYWFKHDLERISARLKELHIPFSKMDKPESIARWNCGKLPIGLIHPASAGHGLNLQAGGSKLIWFGLTWSLELYQQTNARLWRQGQRSDTVVIQHIIARDTIDEQIMQVLLEKDRTQGALIEAVRANL